MNREEIDKVQEEATQRGETPKRTFAYKMLVAGQKVVSWFVMLSGIALIAQILFIAMQSEWDLKIVEIPGIGTLFLMAGTVAAAVFGVEKAIDSVNKFKGK